MPKINPKATLPEWADPENASVFDPLYKTLIRKAVGLAGLDDPSSILQAATPTVSPLISIFKDKAAREAGGKVFQELIKKLPEKMQKGYNSFSESYPRIAAHMRPQTLPSHLAGHEGAGDAFIMPKASKVTEPVPVYITKSGVKNATEGRFKHLLGDNVAENTPFHEGTHVAQWLGSGEDFAPLYTNSRQITGYADAPHEIKARLAEPFSSVVERVPAGKTANQMIQHLAERVDSKGSFSPREIEAANELKRILLKRAQTGWTPSD